jgi:predicted CoA-binding protein
MLNTLVIGASLNPERYSYKAIEMLRKHEHDVIAFGPKTGMVNGVSIENEWNNNWKVDTVTLYLNPQRQEGFYEKIIALHPTRVILNPATENDLFNAQLQAAGIQTENACTLVLLSIGNY